MTNSNLSNTNATMACNRLLLKQLREQRGYTQAEMAKLAGYSERLIIKSESGRSISFRTIEDIADALSTDGQKIYPEDLTCDPVSLAMKYTDAVHLHQANAVDAMRHWLDEDLVFIVKGDPALIPFAGIHRGADALDRAFKIFFSILEVPSQHDYKKHYRYLAQGTEAVIWGESWMHPIGRPLTEPVCISQLLRFRKGRLYHFEDHYDTQMTTKLLNPSPEAAQSSGIPVS